MAGTKKIIKKPDPRKFIWGDGEPEFDVICYDDEARMKMVAALLAESRAMLKNS